jgi:hypothetical protein
MNEQLQAMFAQHKNVVLGVAGAGVVGLALLQRKKAAKGAGPSPSPAGTIPAAGVVPSSGVQGAFPDTSATDIYNSLSDQMQKLFDQQAAQTSNSNGGLTTPAPIASTLFAPTYSGSYATTSTGQPVEIESDGSLFHLNTNFINQVQQKGGTYSALAQDPGWYSLTGNLQAKQSGTSPQVMRYDSAGNLVPAAGATT